ERGLEGDALATRRLRVGLVDRVVRLLGRRVTDEVESRLRARAALRTRPARTAARVGRGVRGSAACRHDQRGDDGQPQRDHGPQARAIESFVHQVLSAWKY